MARLGGMEDTGGLRVRQKNVDGGETFLVSAYDFVHGAYDPEHYEIVSFGNGRRVTMLDGKGNALMNDDGTPRMGMEYDPVPDDEKAALISASAKERTQAHADAREIAGG